MARSAKVGLERKEQTARSKGFAFVEFSDRAVAEVAAQAMHGYMMFGKQLIVQKIEDHKVTKKTMRNANRKWTFSNPVRAHIEWYNRVGGRGIDAAETEQRGEALQRELLGL